MLAFSSTPIMDTLITLPPVLFSLVIHEYAHARTAFAFGDRTAYAMGRMTLNPLAHLDPMGTILIALTGFGWAKPVPVNPANLHPPKWGDIAVSLAGPMSNLFLAAVTAGLLRLWWAVGPQLSPDVDFFINKLAVYLISVNFILCVFNMIPLFPLDGHHVVREFLPLGQQQSFMQWQVRFGSMALLILLFGPRLVSAVTNRSDIPDPLSWVFHHVASLVRLVLGG
jgi:Zn-dependent protease